MNGMHTAPAAEAASAWPDGPVPYTLTAQAEALLDAQAEPELEPEL